MKAVFVELPAFERLRADYLGDDGFRGLQDALMKDPAAGDVIEGTGGLRKLRHADPRRGKGKRGGLRVIYYWWDLGSQFWLFTLYDKDEVGNLSPQERKALKERVKLESRHGARNESQGKTESVCGTERGFRCACGGAQRQADPAHDRS